MTVTRDRSQQLICEHRKERDRGDLPNAIQQKCQHSLHNVSHFLPSSSSSLCKRASFFGVRCFVSTRLITRLSADPPNKRSTMSLMCWPTTWLRLTTG